MKDFPVSLQDKEVSYGAHAPRILALDDYFLMEVEKSEQDPDTGKKIKKKVSKCTGFLLIFCIEGKKPKIAGNFVTCPSRWGCGGA